MQKLSNKQSTKVICRFDRLRTAHTARVKGHMSNGILVIVWTIISACYTSYILPDRLLYAWDNKSVFYSSHAYCHIAVLMQSAYKK